MKLVVATRAMLESLKRDRDAFAELVGSPIPDGWPEFPEAIDFTIATLTEAPHDADWWMHLFVVDGRLVGSGGFVGPPTDGAVEIGYEIAPEFRGRGFATDAARAMIDKARAAGGVHVVLAHTLPSDNPSTSVLRHLEFRLVGEVADDEEGTVWRWERAIT